MKNFRLLLRVRGGPPGAAACPNPPTDPPSLLQPPSALYRTTGQCSVPDAPLSAKQPGQAQSHARREHFHGATVAREGGDHVRCHLPPRRHRGSTAGLGVRLGLVRGAGANDASRHPPRTATHFRLCARPPLVPSCSKDLDNNDVCKPKVSAYRLDRSDTFIKGTLLGGGGVVRLLFP